MKIRMHTIAGVLAVLTVAGGVGLTLAAVTYEKPRDLVEECVRAGDRLIAEYPHLLLDAETPLERKNICAAAVANGEIESMDDIRRDVDYVRQLMEYGTVNT